MGLFDFLHRPSEKNTQEAIKEVKKMPTMMSIYREDGTQTEVLNIEGHKNLDIVMEVLAV